MIMDMKELGNLSDIDKLIQYLDENKLVVIKKSAKKVEIEEEVLEDEEEVLEEEEVLDEEEDEE